MGDGPIHPAVIMRVMRHWILALMIALLPLRGWVGDAMATQMASPRLAQQVVSASGSGSGAHVHASMASVHDHSDALQADAAPVLADCVGHAGSGNPSSPELSHCQSCVACQACHTVALAVPACVFAGLFAAPDLPRSVAPRFTSADRALGLKPPIS